MGRRIVVEFGGAVSRFDLKKVDRSKLYGKRQRVALDSRGEPCERAELMDDGSVLLRQGMTAQAYFDEDGRWIPKAELVGIAPDGSEAPKLPSTLDVEQTARLVPPEEPEVGDLLLRGACAALVADGAAVAVALFPEWSPWFATFQDRGFLVHAGEYNAVARSFDPRFDSTWLRDHWWYQPSDTDLV